MDEIGSAVWHSDTPNVKTCPFLFVDDKSQLVSYTLLWPIKDLQAGEVITRDYVPAGGFTVEQRHAYLCAWVRDDPSLKKVFLDSRRNGKQDNTLLDLASLKISEAPASFEKPSIFTDIVTFQLSSMFLFQNFLYFISFVYFSEATHQVPGFQEI